MGEDADDGAAFEDTTWIRGTVSLPPGAKLSEATIYVRVAEVARADAPATIVAERALDATQFEGAGRVPFALRIESVAPDGRYVLQVHVDVDGDGRVSRGDLITTRAYPIRLDQSEQTLDVDVQPVS